MNCVLVCVLSLSALAPDAKVPEIESRPELRERLETAVPEAIRLLEAKQYVTFLRLFAHPDELKQFTDGQPLDQFAANFGEKKSAVVLKVLKAIKDLKPTLEADGSKAVYTLNEAVDRNTSMIWVKVDKYWYMQNRRG